MNENRTQISFPPSSARFPLETLIYQDQTRRPSKISDLLLYPMPPTPLAPPLPAIAHTLHCTNAGSHLSLKTFFPWDFAQAAPSQNRPCFPSMAFATVLIPRISPAQHLPGALTEGPTEVCRTLCAEPRITSSNCQGNLRR